MSVIKAGSPWGFVRRTVDLLWIVRHCLGHGFLISIPITTEAGLGERLQEIGPERSCRDNLDAERAKHGLERISAAPLFGR